MTDRTSFANSQWPCGATRSQNNDFCAVPRGVIKPAAPKITKQRPSKAEQSLISLETPEERRDRQTRARMMKAATRVNKQDFVIETAAQSQANKDKQRKLLGAAGGGI